MGEKLGYYAARLIGGAKRKPSMQRISKRKLDSIDYAMQKGGYDEYDLGILWADQYFSWVLYACVMFDQG